MAHTPDARPDADACESHREAMELLRLHRDLGVALSSVSDLDAALDAILAAVLKVPGADAAGIYLVTPDRRGIELIIHGGLSPQFVAEAHFYPADSPQFEVVAAGKPVYDASAYLGGPLPPVCANEGIRGLMIMPVRFEQQVLGTLNIASRRQAAFSPAAQHALESMADDIGSVIRRVQADEQRRAAEAKLLTIVHHSPYAYAELDLEGTVTFCNERAAELVGLSCAELIGQNMARFLGEADLARARTDMNEMARTQTGSLREYTAQMPDGRQRHIEAASQPLVHGGVVHGFFTMMLDVTEKREAERRIRENEARLRGLFEHLPDSVIEMDREARIIFANRSARDDSPESLLGQSGFSFLAPDCRQQAESLFHEVVTRVRPASIQVTDVFGSCWASRLVPVVADGAVKSILAINTDVTRQKDDAEAIQLERQALRQLIDFHERDRRALAYDVHDGLAQKLTAIGLLMESYQRMLPTAPDKAAQLLDQMRQWVGDVLKVSRRLISGLRPPILDELGIVPAIEYLINERHMSGGPRIDFAPDVSFDRLAAPLESALFRIVEEALGNACRHSGSRRITVGLSDSNGQIDVSVEDWGHGFDLSQVREDQFGLQRIRAHVRILGGDVSITSAIGQGTRIAAVLPRLERLPE